MSLALACASLGFTAPPALTNTVARTPSPLMKAAKGETVKDLEALSVALNPNIGARGRRTHPIIGCMDTASPTPPREQLHGRIACHVPRSLLKL